MSIITEQQLIEYKNLNTEIKNLTKLADKLKAEIKTAMVLANETKVTYPSGTLELRQSYKRDYVLNQDDLNNDPVIKYLNNMGVLQSVIKTAVDTDKLNDLVTAGVLNAEYMESLKQVKSVSTGLYVM